MLNRGSARSRQAARILGQVPAEEAPAAPAWADNQAGEPLYAAEDEQPLLHEELAEEAPDGPPEYAPPPDAFAASTPPLGRSSPEQYPGRSSPQHRYPGTSGVNLWGEPEPTDQPGEQAWDEEPPAEERANPRGLVPARATFAPASRSGVGKVMARMRGEPDDPALWRGPTPSGPVMVPGKRHLSGQRALGHVPFAPGAKRHRSLLMQVLVVGIAALMLLGTAFAIAPLSTEQQILSGLNSLAGSDAASSTSTDTYHWYVVHYGDSLQSIAARFGVLPGGILLMNGLQSADQLYVGLRLKIPVDPNYGVAYQQQLDIPIPPPDKAGNVFGTNPWNSTSGATDPNNVCAPPGDADTSAHRQIFQLIEPNPNATFARGFTWFHNGVDLDNPPGTPILAAQAGLVVFAGWDNLGLGYSVKINHCNGLSTMYGHMRDFPLVHAGDYVSVGQQVGFEGSTGNSTGPHLHFMTEWWNKPANPYCFDFNLPPGDTACTVP